MRKNILEYCYTYIVLTVSHSIIEALIQVLNSEEKSKILEPLIS